MWMGIDVGTSGTRALVVDAQGRVAAGFTAAHEDIRMERPLWAEQRPQNWWDAARVAIRGALAEAGVSGSQVRGIGLSGQMHGLVILDRDNAVIRPALIWCDQRSQPQVDAINETVGRENVLKYTANPVLTGFTLPKLLWVRDNEPRAFERVRHLLLPKDYLRFQLTAEYASEVSDASGTSLFDVVARRWSCDMMDALGLDRAILPTSHESSDVTGRVTRAAAAATGLAEGTPVVGGGGDQASSAVGNGIVEAGIVSCTLGTSGVVFAHMEHVAYDPAGRVHTFCHAVRDKWHVMGVTQSAGLSFRWLMGERTPHLDATARGGWIGLTARHQRADLIRAIIEGVCYSQRDCLDIIDELGVPVASVRASGGGARSPFWRQLLADIFDKKVVTLETQEGSAYGAALLALAGTGEYSSVPEVCRATIREVDSIAPRPAEASFYAEAHRVYGAIYPALKPVYGEIANLADGVPTSGDTAR